MAGLSGLQIASIFLALNLFLLIWLGWQVVKLRQSEKIGLGHGESETLLRAMRIQANLTEYAPLFFIGLFALAVMNAPVWEVAVFGLVFTIARYAHALNFFNKSGSGTPLGRFYGTLFTWISILAMGLALLWQVFMG